MANASILRVLVFLEFLCASFFVFSIEDFDDLDPLKRYDDVPEKTETKAPRLLNSKQKDAKVFFFESIVLQDCTVLSEKTQKRLIKPYLNKKLSINDLNKLITAIHETYQDAGYVLDDVYFKKESFKKPRCLVVFLVEVKLCGLRFLGEGKRGRRINSLLNIDANRVLKITELKSAFNILNQLETISYDSKLNTNQERTLHAMDIMLKKHKKCVFGLGYDNQGSTSTGQDRYTVETRFEDVLGVFDQWRFLYMTTRKPFNKERYSKTGMISLSIPYRRWRASFACNFSKDKYHLTDRVSLEDDVIELTADLRYALSLTENSGTYVGTTLRHRSTQYHLGDFWDLTKSGDTTKWILWGSYFRYIFGGRFNGRLSYSQGIQASNGGIGRLFDKNFKILNIEGSFQRSFKNRWMWTLTGDMQIGEPDLYNHEKFSLGGMSTVRGFLNTQYSTDSGYFVRNELEYLVFNRYATRFFVGHDCGRSKPSKFDNDKEKTLQSICFGVRLVVKGVNFEVLMARPIHTELSNRYTFLLGISGNF